MEGLKVPHPLNSKAAVHNVHLVHDDNEGELGAVQDAAGVEHVGAEGDGAHAASSVQHIDHHRGEGGGLQRGGEGRGGEDEEDVSMLCSAVWNTTDGISSLPIASPPVCSPAHQCV